MISRHTLLGFRTAIVDLPTDEGPSIHKAIGVTSRIMLDLVDEILILFVHLLPHGSPCAHVAWSAEASMKFAAVLGIAKCYAPSPNGWLCCQLSLEPSCLTFLWSQWPRPRIRKRNHRWLLENGAIWSNDWWIFCRISVFHHFVYDLNWFNTLHILIQTLLSTKRCRRLKHWKQSAIFW